MAATVADATEPERRRVIRAHGTRTKYVHDRCRCDACRRANTDYAVALDRAKNAGPYRCRCVGSNRLYLVTHKRTKAVVFRGRDRVEAYRVRDEMNEAVAVDEPLWAGSGTIAAIRKHVRGLQARGLGLKVIAATAGVTSTRLGEIVRGKSYNKKRPRRRHLKMVTAEKILAVMATTDVADGALVPAAETWRLIEELRALGVPKAHIAKALGAKSPALQLRRDFVRARNARKVRELHDRAREKSETFRTEHCRCPEVA